MNHIAHVRPTPRARVARGVAQCCSGHEFRAFRLKDAEWTVRTREGVSRRCFEWRTTYSPSRCPLCDDPLWAFRADDAEKFKRLP
jgi:hypothetical protein